MYIINSPFGKLFADALIKKYEAEIAEATSTLHLYFEQMKAIGEHSDLLAEHDKWVTKLDTATSKLETFKKHFSVNGNAGNF